jgi:hypothetical protein
VTVAVAHARTVGADAWADAIVLAALAACARQHHTGGQRRRRKDGEMRPLFDPRYTQLKARIAGGQANVLRNVAGAECARTQRQTLTLAFKLAPSLVVVAVAHARAVGAHAWADASVLAALAACARQQRRRTTAAAQRWRNEASVGRQHPRTVATASRSRNKIMPAVCV